MSFPFFCVNFVIFRKYNDKKTTTQKQTNFPLQHHQSTLITVNILLSFFLVCLSDEPHLRKMILVAEWTLVNNSSLATGEIKETEAKRICILQKAETTGVLTAPKLLHNPLIC